MRLSLLHESGPDSEKIPDDTNNEYIQPDTFVNQRGSVTFFYTAEGHLYFNNQLNINHEKMIAMYPDLYERYSALSGIKTGDYRAIRNAKKGYPETVDITGRTGKAGAKHFCSIWNFKTDMIEKLMPGCIAALLRRKVVTADTIVTTPVTDNATVADWQAGKVQIGAAKTPEEEERLELLKRLHNMASPEKHAAMKKLGLGAGFGSEFKGRPQEPGVKWWAPTSESRRRRPTARR